MEPAVPKYVENELLRAHLLITHGKYQEARALIQQLEKQGAPRQDLDSLHHEMEAKSASAKAEERSLRDQRYYLGLQTTTSRIWAMLVAIATLIYSLWNGYLSVERGMAHGFAANVTTQIYARHGTWDWTHPAYWDVIYSAVLLIVAVTMIGVVIRVSKGAMPWEELDVADSDRSQFNWPI
jgi:hypothetical protein